MVNIFISPYFPNENFGGDYKNSLVYKLYSENLDRFTAEIKSAIIKTFNPIAKSYTSIKVVNKPDELLQLATYLFDYIALDEPERLLAQCNHTFVFNLHNEQYVHVGFSVDDVLMEKPLNLYL
jgi:hypothetical protein